ASRIAVSGAPAAGLRAPDEPAPLGATADPTDVDRRGVRARNGAAPPAPLPADAELLDDEDLDLFDDLDDLPVEGRNGSVARPSDGDRAPRRAVRGTAARPGCWCCAPLL